MSNRVEDSEGFIRVTYRRPKKCINKTLKSVSSNVIVNIISPEDFSKKLDNAKADLLNSSFVHDFRSLLYSALTYCGFLEKNCQTVTQQNCFSCPDELSYKGYSSVAEIVCYGLGSFLSSVTAQYQLAFLIILKDLFLPTPDVFLYDPVFSIHEVSVLKKLNFSVLDHNEEGKRTSLKPTIFFMPHCGKPLYNSVLWSNWSVDGLQKIIIIGNSFTNVVETVPKSEKNYSLSYIFQAQPLILEHSVSNNFKFIDIFNSLSVHSFPITNLTQMPQNFWERGEEPCYTSDDEIITNSVK